MAEQPGDTLGWFRVRLPGSALRNELPWPPMKRTTTFFGIVLALFAAAFVINATAGCYRNCDPKTDRDCPCPPGACGPYPGEAKLDAGADG